MFCPSGAPPRFLVWIVHAALNQATQKSTSTLIVEAWRKVYRPTVHVAWPNRVTKGEDYVKHKTPQYGPVGHAVTTLTLERWHEVVLCETM